MLMLSSAVVSTVPLTRLLSTNRFVLTLAGLFALVAILEKRD